MSDHIRCTVGGTICHFSACNDHLTLLMCSTKEQPRIYAHCTEHDDDLYTACKHLHTHRARMHAVVAPSTHTLRCLEEPNAYRTQVLI